MGRQRSGKQDDFDRVKDANHKLKTENRNLRKENARLRKELNRFDGLQFEAEEEETLELIIVPEREKEPALCPKCKSDSFLQVPAGKYLINVCKASGCGYRKRSKSGIDC